MAILSRHCEPVYLYSVLVCLITESATGGSGRVRGEYKDEAELEGSRTVA